MDFTHTTLGKNDNGRRLDRVLKRLFAGQPASFWQAALRKNLIYVNGKKASASLRIAEGDTLSVATVLLSKNQQEEYEPKMVPTADMVQRLPILFKNEHILVLNKPAGISVQKPQKNAPALDDVVKALYKAEAPHSISFMPGPLHRLDRQTSGVLVFSQSLLGAQWFTNGMKAHTYTKEYVALVEGRFLQRERWEDHIDTAGKRTKSGFFTVHIEPQQEANAYTTAIPLKEGWLEQATTKIPVTLTKYIIETGKKHQIRAQSAFHGHPLVGDTAYRSRIQLPLPVSCGFLLHAHKLTFGAENQLGLPEWVEAPLPDYFDKILKLCLINYP